MSKKIIKRNNGKESIKEYDENNNLIYNKDSNGFEHWYEYDENNNLIHYKDSDGEHWYTYDKRNNLIYDKDSKGYESWNEYDENNNLTHHKISSGFEHWKEYDENGNCIHIKDSNGFEWWYEYDENNNLIHYKDSMGCEWENEYFKNNKPQKEDDSGMFKLFTNNQELLDFVCKLYSNEFSMSVTVDSNRRLIFSSNTRFVPDNIVKSAYEDVDFVTFSKDDAALLIECCNDAIKRLESGTRRDNDVEVFGSKAIAYERLIDRYEGLIYKHYNN